LDYLLHIAILIGIYAILSISLNLVTGFGGVISLAHAGFYGIGAYVAAILALKGGTPFLLNVLCSGLVAGLLGALISLPAARVKDDYFVVVTLAFQIIVYGLMMNCGHLTGGAMGLSGIPAPKIIGLALDSHIAFLMLVIVLVAFAFGVARAVVVSPVGRLLRSLREDIAFSHSIGKDVRACKIQIFAASAGMASMAGVIYAHYISFIDPTSFTAMESIFILSIVIIGGAGSLWGPVLGAVVLVLLPELLRFVGMPSSVAANVRQILYGAALVACMIWRPQGLIGEYSFRKNDTS